MFTLYYSLKMRFCQRTRDVGSDFAVIVGGKPSNFLLTATKRGCGRAGVRFAPATM